MQRRNEVILYINEVTGVLNINELNRLAVPNDILEIAAFNLRRFNKKLENFNRKSNYCCLRILTLIMIISGVLVFNYYKDFYLFGLILICIGGFLKIILICMRCSKMTNKGEILMNTINQLERNTFGILELFFGYDRQNQEIERIVQKHRLPEFFLFRVNFQKLRSKMQEEQNLQEPFIN